MSKVTSERCRKRIEKVDGRGLRANDKLFAHITVFADEHVAEIVEAGGLVALREAGYTATADAVKAWLTETFFATVQAEVAEAQT